MSDSASISSGIADRYATAIFELAKEENNIGALEAGADLLDAALKESAEFRDLISSPVYSRDEQAGAIGAIAKKLELAPMLSNALALMASKRRLFVLPQLVASLRALIAEEKGEMTADVISAQPLSKANLDELTKVLSASADKTVKVNATVDNSLIGGLVVKMGSKMIDTSIRAKLNALQNTMKEVG
ncbi:ATP synthase delta chain [Dinoroseobacter shibae DFL 12 = DSM 16493]|uniref:ATP synthase subunit delta n=1 Tax=Dinoroseobacter shibae (strain DSM 16493 / NCIMB 14021 / DFL 12) TaxID=398580 RepID=ATPD_DINSH|nr:F0F1 ATP synthase subunit delta [Dinoroseobacter shibae]A8LJR7.1 RecName: Full=ATP synthase subunit delta; AltName: Full=ATP synthase F(1) sector subunit delta; AltName: Full=F-type ATPase subunit delta; Short=F-ATPase subunit delta [Dinoroseobacter shibae DFL 12 = DSM 16493]ABV94670.1 ATP synthase delta chain [Dinoroseobacter shibae DFL 12 = DSM 16493]URF46093.1 F0F1 ATP synthase subunit delta [Dinoroseobacter shibae]URF50400.1 F0F1 ATP synthase subunit delta [Dinoroseobacter shibae]